MDQPGHIVGGVDITFRHDGDAARQARAQIGEGVRVDGDGVQVVVGDADKARAQGQRTPEFLVVMDFNHRRHAQVPGECIEIVECCIIQYGDDEQNCIRIRGPCGIKLIEVKDEGLVQNGKRDGLVDGVQGVKVVVGTGGLCEHADSGCAIVRVGAGQCHRIVGWSVSVLARWGLLNLGYQTDAGDLERSEEVTGRRRIKGLMYPVVSRTALFVLGDFFPFVSDEGIKGGSGCVVFIHLMFFVRFNFPVWNSDFCQFSTKA